MFWCGFEAEKIPVGAGGRQWKRIKKIEDAELWYGWEN
jgi:hypothetical protein